MLLAFIIKTSPVSLEYVSDTVASLGGRPTIMYHSLTPEEYYTHDTIAALCAVPKWKEYRMVIIESGQVMTEYDYKLMLDCAKKVCYFPERRALWTTSRIVSFMGGELLNIACGLKPKIYPRYAIMYTTALIISYKSSRHEITIKQWESDYLIAKYPNRGLRASSPTFTIGTPWRGTPTTPPSSSPNILRRNDGNGAGGVYEMAHSYMIGVQGADILSIISSTTSRNDVQLWSQNPNTALATNTSSVLRRYWFVPIVAPTIIKNTKNVSNSSINIISAAIKREISSQLTFTPVLKRIKSSDALTNMSLRGYVLAATPSRDGSVAILSIGECDGVMRIRANSYSINCFERLGMVYDPRAYYTISDDGNDVFITCSSSESMHVIADINEPHSMVWGANIRVLVDDVSPRYACGGIYFGTQTRIRAKLLPLDHNGIRNIQHTIQPHSNYAPSNHNLVYYDSMYTLYRTDSNFYRLYNKITLEVSPLIHFQDAPIIALCRHEARILIITRTNAYCYLPEIFFSLDEPIK